MKTCTITQLSLSQHCPPLQKAWVSVCVMPSTNLGALISGPLSAATGLTATHNATSITISWEAPWSLDVTDVDPDIWYSVLIQNVTDENNPTPISCTDCTNITETVYTFTPDHLSPCHVYNFSVTPFNGAGQGEDNFIKIISMLLVFVAHNHEYSLQEVTLLRKPMQRLAAIMFWSRSNSV